MGTKRTPISIALRRLHLLPLLALLSVNSSAPAQWQAIRLHPEGDLGWLALAPPSTTEASQLFAISGSIQVGVYTTAANPNFSASLWSDTPGSRVDLNPAGAYASTAAACLGNEQVGYALMNGANGNEHAGLWHGTAASWVDLNPSAIARESYAQATDGPHQFGFVALLSDGSNHAAMWSGTIASFVDMNPPGATQSSIRGIGGNQQAGAVSYPGSLNPHAALWFGTPQSAVDLHPIQSGSGYSGLYATDGLYQVGVASIGGGPHAGLWRGTAASFVDLQDFLPPGYGSSTATCVEEYQGQTWVGGYARNSSGNSEAFLWVSVPAPASTTILIASGLLAARRRRPRL
jgi:hypothetical protein